MNRTLKLSFVSAFTMVGAAVIVACSSAAPTDDTDQGAARLSDYTVHPVVKSDCATPKAGIARQNFCRSVRRTDVVNHDALSPDATVSGFGPTDFASAYNIPSGLTGTPTVAIVDAQDDPNAESDLAVYRKQFGLPACTTANGCFKKVSQTGSTTGLPTGDTGWGGEISLDLDMVSAVCPNCKILLVEAASAGDDLYTAVDYAASVSGVVAISNSWSGGEDSTITGYEKYFQHSGIFITVAAGDSDTGAGYPTTSAYVTAVGGTTLVKNSSTRGWTETVWDTSSSEGTGSGCSAYIAQPSFQTTTLTTCAKRAESDLSAVADPNTGVAVYDTYGGSSAGASGWEVYGGTSAATPIVAALFAYLGKATTATNAYSYSNTANFYDVTSGSNGSCSSDKKICTAGVGWDGPTGNGTPNAGAIYGTTTPPPPADAGTDSGSKDSGTDSGTKDSGTDSGTKADAGKDSGAGTCSHDVCATGTKLTTTCDTCATDVCKSDSYCCSTKWDDICVSEVAEFCAAGTTSCN
jgi:subtilase family serine protease